jgi:hypothetical protein
MEFHELSCVLIDQGTPYTLNSESMEMFKGYDPGALSLNYKYIAEYVGVTQYDIVYYYLPSILIYGEYVSVTRYGITDD